MKKAAGILLLVLLVAAFALPGSADMNKYSTVFMDTFDTVISLIGYAENQETLRLMPASAPPAKISSIPIEYKTNIIPNSSPAIRIGKWLISMPTRASPASAT